MVPLFTRSEHSSPLLGLSMQPSLFVNANPSFVPVRRDRIREHGVEQGNQVCERGRRRPPRRAKSGSARGERLRRAKTRPFEGTVLGRTVREKASPVIDERAGYRETLSVPPAGSATWRL